MHRQLTMEEIDGLLHADLHQAEECFDEVKTRILSDVVDYGSFVRVRSYLKSLESILAERHEARRVGAGLAS